MKRIFPLAGFMLLALISCSPPKEISVVDGEGDPVEGALIISEQNAYILQRWRLGVYVTDEEGRAMVTTDRGYVFKPGYFPVIEASELTDGLLWSPFLLLRSSSDFAAGMPIYPIKPEENIRVKTISFKATTPLEGGTVVVPTEICESSSVVYNLEKSQFLVQSENEDLMPSKRFYFVSGDGNKEVSQIERENNIAFYCNDNGGLYKIGMSVSGKGSFAGKRNHGIKIFIAKVPAIDAYLQPEIKCMTEKNLYLAPEPHHEDSPVLHTSKDVKNKISTFRDNIPCANKYSDEFFDQIESFF